MRIWSDLEIVTGENVASKTITMAMETHEAVVVNAALNSMIHDKFWNEQVIKSIKEDDDRVWKFMQCAIIMHAALNQKLTDIGVVADGQPA